MSAREITAALGGKWCGSYGMACCPVHADKTPSLKVSDSDNTDDGIDVVCFAGCEWRAVKDELRGTGLLPAFEPGQSTPRPPRQQRPKNIEPDPEAIKRTEAAREIWRATQPITPDTPAWRYLSARGTEPDQIGGIPATLRYGQGLRHSPTGLYLPALVAAVTVWPNRDVCAIHRTFLKIDGSAKAPSSQAKMLLGPSSGGAVRLAPATDELIVCEGIETGLSVLQITGKPTWAATSAGGLVGLQLPDLPLAEQITIAADNDMAGQQAAEKAAAKWIRDGRTVEISTPPQQGADWNDALQKDASWAA